ncbi:MAG: hypothetical protein P1U58_12500 [Verrucomicrobiales bacterium]|nr:hypothetical protein [Verrucomicrobiales bacterium]
MPATLTALPSPGSGWVLVSGSEIRAEESSLSALVGKQSDVVIGLPASKVSTFCVLLPVTDDSLHENMIFAQVEKRGLAAGSQTETIYDFVSVKSDESGETFAVSVVSPLNDEWIVNQAHGYAPTAALQTPPEGGARLWREHNRLVLGIFQNDEPVHVQALSSGAEVNGNAAQEISLLLLSLGGDTAFDDMFPSGTEVAIGDLSEAAKEDFEKALSIPVTSYRDRVESRPEATGRLRLLPEPVLKFRKSRKTKKSVAAVMSVLLVVYLVAAAWLWIEGKRVAREVESLERQIAIVEPDVTRIQQISQRWSRLEPAFEKTWFPLVQLNSFTSALPGSGVVVREFRTTGRNLRIRGQARDVQFANRLLEDLQAMDAFSSYDWSMPNPKVEKNNTATFEIEGKPSNAGADS